MSLRIIAHEDLRDPVRGLLRATMTGDLIGWSEWQITPAAEPHSATQVHFRQEVVLTKHIHPLVLWLLRPALFANHRHMMRSGERGVRRFIADSSAASH